MMGQIMRLAGERAVAVPLEAQKVFVELFKLVSPGAGHLVRAVSEKNTARLPRSTRQVGAYIAREFGIVSESRSGLIALLHRLGFEYSKPEVIGRKLDVEKQKAFIDVYENLLNSLGADEAVLFVDAVHPTHGGASARLLGFRPRKLWPSSKPAGEPQQSRRA